MDDCLYTCMYDIAWRALEVQNLVCHFKCNYFVIILSYITQNFLKLAHLIGYDQNIPWSYKNMVSNFVVEFKNNEGNGLSIRDLKLKQHLKFRKCAGQCEFIITWSISIRFTSLELTYRQPPNIASWRTSFVGPFFCIHLSIQTMPFSATIIEFDSWSVIF